MSPAAGDGASGKAGGPIACDFMSGDGGARSAGPQGEVAEVIDLLRRYLIQETVDPLKLASRTLLYGSAAAVLIGIGIVLLLLGVLRVLQTETGTVFEGSLSWLPYLITAVSGLVVVGSAGFLLLRSSGGGRGARAANRGGTSTKTEVTVAKRTEVA